MTTSNPRVFWLAPRPIDTYFYHGEYFPIEEQVMTSRITHGWVLTREVLPNEPDYKTLCEELAETTDLYIKSRNVVSKELDWDLFDALKEALAKYREAMKEEKPECESHQWQVYHRKDMSIEKILCNHCGIDKNIYLESLK